MIDSHLKPGLFPRRATQLLGTGFIGDSKRAHLELTPLRWDRTYGQLILVKRMTVKILFKGRDKDEVPRAESSPS